ncbi:class I SAM-dependent methyltransferase, partial [Aphanizomenon flos-aquae CCAP 1446/1C]
LEQTIEKLSTEIQYEDSVKAREVNEKITQLEQIIEKLSTEIQTDNSNTNSFVASETAKMRSGLWFNEPIIIGYSGDGEAYWAVTNERIVEKTFVIHSLAHFCNSKKIELLDVGAAESLLSYELASFNYSVTAIDIRPIALSHPNLKFVKSDICQAVFSPASFDCVIALSTLEHLGLGWYGDEKINSYDLEAVKQINLLLKSEGIFILTVPYGRKAITPVHRIYDQESLQKLTQDFTVMQISYGVRKDSFTWTITENELEASVQEHNPDNYLPGAVAMLVCKKKS